MWTPPNKVAYVFLTGATIVIVYLSMLCFPPHFL